MTEQYIFLGGWSRDEGSYRRLEASVPQGVKLHVIPHIDILGREKTPSEIECALEDRLEQFGAGKFVLMGHSIGAALLMPFVAEHPERVSRLVLIDVAGIPKPESSLVMILHAAQNALQYTRGKASENMKSIARVLRRPSVYIDAARYAQNVDIRKDASNIHTKTLILWGEKDTITPLREGNILQALIPGSKLVLLHGMDHDWPVHAPELLWQSLKDEKFI